MHFHFHDFQEESLLNTLRHYLPAQGPLKDFIHHNTLHAFQDKLFFDGVFQASAVFGYKVLLSQEEYIKLFEQGKIKKEILNRVRQQPEFDSVKEDQLFSFDHSAELSMPWVGSMRRLWKEVYRIDINAHIHGTIFKVLNSFLDQGIADWKFPLQEDGFLSSFKALEEKSLVSFFKTKKARELLLKGGSAIEDLLKIIVGEPRYYNQYLLDQQFAHPGWSGLVAVLEHNPTSLLDSRKITLKDWILLELLFEVDLIEYYFSERWTPFSTYIDPSISVDPFQLMTNTDKNKVLAIWHQAFEWSYYDEVLAGISLRSNSHRKTINPNFQAIFCIDDRECSLRRNLETLDPSVQTFGTPGHFNLEFYYQPEYGKFYTKVCPAPITPKYLIKEFNTQKAYDSDIHFQKRSHHLIWGTIISQTVGFWSAVKLFLQIFRPSLSPASAFSFQHMRQDSSLTFEHMTSYEAENGLQVGFTIAEMAIRLEALFKSIGLVGEFAPLVYVMGHGASSVNNTHYAGYDCGACSGRPGSVNARTFCAMANHPRVRELLHERGINIPQDTQFIGGLHDTTRDEFVFYDVDSLSYENYQKHLAHIKVFQQAMKINAKERSRRFDSIDTKASLEEVHRKVKQRSVSLFEPRPELNHATNSLCVIARRSLTEHLYLDRRAFLNSYDYRQDPDGQYLLNILNAAAPVCGGINLEYFFSRVDNHKLGAGTKLPHNVMGLNAVANGMEGDARPGLPLQMIELHDPIRLLMIVEHEPEVLLRVIQKNKATYEWFSNYWIHLICIHPETQKQFLFKEGHMIEYQVLADHISAVDDLFSLWEHHSDHLSVYTLNK